MGKLEIKRGDIGSSIGFIIFVIIFLIIYFFIIENFKENNKDIVLTDYDTGDVILIESKYLWGGVWFNKDRLNILYKKFDVEKNSLINGKETVQLPFNKIKKVILSEGFGIYEIKIESEDGFFNKTYNFYVQNKDHFEIVKNKIFEVGGGSLIVEETRTFLNRFDKSNKKKPLTQI
mgnify:CR=1 FL=1